MEYTMITLPKAGSPAQIEQSKRTDTSASIRTLLKETKPAISQPDIMPEKPAVINTQANETAQNDEESYENARINENAPKREVVKKDKTPAVKRATKKSDALQAAPKDKAPAPAKQSGKRKSKGELVDIKKEMAKQAQAKETKKLKESSDSESDSKDRKDFSTLFAKKKTKSVFTARPEASSFFANLSFSDYEPDTSER